MGAGDKGMAHQGILTTHGLGKYRVQGNPVPGRRSHSQWCRGDDIQTHCFDKGRKDLQLIVFSNLINCLKTFF